MDSDAVYWEMLLWHKVLYLLIQPKGFIIVVNMQTQEIQEPLSDLRSGTFLFHVYVWRLGEIVPNIGLAVEIACTTTQSDNILSFTFV